VIYGALEDFPPEKTHIFSSEKWGFPPGSSLEIPNLESYHHFQGETRCSFQGGSVKNPSSQPKERSPSSMGSDTTSMSGEFHLPETSNFGGPMVTWWVKGPYPSCSQSCAWCYTKL